ncbi:hypothetical protein GCM10009663_74080 [Kitasatospora arboriphila]|uniref:Uncharacterized protein n=1 Tax=Kitasatospora arboriphila TaxID=258052 RepID=A0ABP4ER09_9ACTN
MGAAAESVSQKAGDRTVHGGPGDAVTVHRQGQPLPACRRRDSETPVHAPNDPVRRTPNPVGAAGGPASGQLPAQELPPIRLMSPSLVIPCFWPQAARRSRSTGSGSTR